MACFLVLIGASFSVASSKLSAQPKFNVQGIAQRFTHRFTASGLLYCYPEGPRGGSVSKDRSASTKLTIIRNFILYAISQLFRQERIDELKSLFGEKAGWS